MGRKFGRGSAALVDREGNLELQGCLAEAWLVKEAAAILLASWIPDGRSPLKSVNLHTWLHALSHKSTTCVIRIQSIQTWMADERAIAALLLSPPSVIALRPIRIVNHDSHTPLGSRIVTYDHYTTCMHAPTVLTRSGGHSHVIFSPCEDLNALP